MWQKGCSQGESEAPQPDDYVAELNRNRSAGFSDWRLPTTEELASLLEPVANHRTGFVSELFQACSGMASADTGVNKKGWGLRSFAGSFTTDGTRHPTRAVRNVEN
jgi:serine/threonine-protein kinase